MNNSVSSYITERVMAPFAFLKPTSMKYLTDEALIDIGLNRRAIELEDRGQNASDEMSSLWLVTGGVGVFPWEMI